MLPRLRQQRIHQRVVEVSVLRLELLPIDGHLDRIGVQIFNGGQTLGSVAGQALELFTCAPSIR